MSMQAFLLGKPSLIKSQNGITTLPEHLTAEWTSQQILEAFGDAMAPCFMIRARDAVHGLTFRKRVKAKTPHIS